MSATLTIGGPWVARAPVVQDWEDVMLWRGFVIYQLRQMRGRLRGRGPAIAAIALLVLAVLALLLWWVPEWQAERVSGITGKERAELENEQRRTMATVLAGVFVLVSGLVAALNLRLLGQGQITERFTRAIEQLGATHEQGLPKLEVRLGAIYALERIARESAVDHGPVMEILTAYVREHARVGAQPVGSQVPLFGNVGNAGGAEAGVPEQRDEVDQPRADIQAILTVIGRRVRTYGHGETQRLDLSRERLQGAHLQRAHLEGADLQGGYLREAHLQRADLREAHLEGAHLEGAYLWEADLEGASWDETTVFPEGWEGGKPPAASAPSVQR